MSNLSTPTQRWGFFAVISLGLFMIGLDNSILYTALPTLEAQLETSTTEALWIINAYPLVLSGLLLGTGTLGDKIGHRLMFVIGLVIFGVASLAAAYSPSPLALIGARALLGVGAATMMPATLALIRLTFPDEQERNTAIGIWGSVAVVGAGVGPLVGGALLEAFWWGSVFLINVPVAVVALLLTLLLAPENVPHPSKHWDVVSSLYALVALSGATAAIKEAANPERSAALLVAVVAAAVVGGALFGRRQARLDDPLLTFDIFRSRLFTGGVVAAAGAMVVMAGAELQTTQRLQLVDGFTPLQAGAVLLAVAAAALPASILGGANLHRVGFLPLVAGGFAAAVVGLGLATWASRADHLVGFLVALAVLGWSAGSIMSVASVAIIGAAPMSRSGMAAGVEEVSYEFGTLLTVSVTGSLLPLWLARNLERASFDAAYVSAYNSILLLLAGAAAVFAVVTWWCFRDNPKSGEIRPSP
ncbi:MFS transporter [Corynebacterium timonense]|uniref:MFS transporter, DHA2 family, multidrug resistance protein n=1 Tax=Corynebacterium timonense TaxID=441500 RepID=A0A1H1U1D0_9CORY|nr:MFS transporter [Corynebacterium timonense]SDS66375.1 MFS transporter, DHA2 family, multidrug resistance protein [Corynebacterium timonense]